jgi:TolB-like protein/DNA-binding winged helix-turn-helix (wHTH) protein
MRAPSNTSRVIRFGVFEVDSQEERILRSGLRQKLEPQPFLVLQSLLERPGELVTREELRQRLWPDNTFVNYDLALKKCINRIREVLGDSAESPRFIETIPRRGYRFIAPLSRIEEIEEQNTSASSLAKPAEPSSAIGEAQPGRSPDTVFPLGRKRITVVILTLVVAFALTVVLYFLRRGAPRPAGPGATGIKALAVLPLENLSADKDSEYYAEGMTDELITQLAKIKGVRVISRTSVMPFEGKRKSLKEVAQVLKVDAVVEGTVLRSGNRVRITAQLVQVDPEKHLWAESYDREQRDELDLQAEIAQNVARKISASITRSPQASTSVNVEAHESYLRGLYWWHRRGRDAEAKGLEYFKRSVEIDPSYALGWAGIADSYLVMAHHGGLPVGEAMPKAKTAAVKAIELDNSLSEAHASLAEVKLSFDWDYPGADSEFNRAIQLDPNYATAHHWYAHYLVIAGRFDDALSEIELAHQLDPYSAVINSWWSSIYYYEADYQRASEKYQSMLQLDPAVGPLINGSLARVYEQQGDYARAIEEHQRSFSAGGRPQDGTALANAFAAGGPEAYWLKRLSLLEQDAAGKPASALELAFVYSHLGRRDATLSSLERAIQEHDPWVNFFKRDPAFEWLQSEPRFQKLAVRIGLR